MLQVGWGEGRLRVRCLLLLPRGQQCESAGGALCEWSASAPGHPAADRAAGRQRDAAL